MLTESDHIVAEDGGADICRPCRSADDQSRPRRALEGAVLARAVGGRPAARLGAGKTRRGRRSLADGFAILGIAGRYALPVPLAETLLAGWLLSRAGSLLPRRQR